MTKLNEAYKDYSNEEVERFTEFVGLVKKAMVFATKAHKGQYRKGLDSNGNRLEYITHPKSVSRILKKHKSSHRIDILVAVCLLHDTVEDVEWVTIEVIRQEFGNLIASLVEELTSDTIGLETFGKEVYLINKMLNMSSWALGIKLADRLHNLSDVKKRIEGGKASDVKWVKKYCNQTKNIITALDGRTLTSTHLKMIDEISIIVEYGLSNV